MSIPLREQQQHLSRLLGGRGSHEVRRHDEQGSYDEHAERAPRLEVLQRAESEFDPAPFDAEAARLFGRVTAAVVTAQYPARPGGLRQRDSRKMCYCENVKNITVSVPDDVYRNARVAAAQRDTSVSALVVAYLKQLSGRMDEFARLEALQCEVQAGIRQFRAGGRLSRDEVHDRAVR